MALRRPPTTFSDEISAADLAANSVGASELADNAVDTDAIAANAVVTAKIADSTGAADGITTAKLATNAVTTAKITDANITAAKVASNAITKEKIAAEAIEVKPHIKPGVLYPAIKDSGGTVRQVDGVTAVVASTTGPAGSTVTSSLYGTVQSDGRMYYYTDIKGSKPIKDPRIGAHFGCQRFKTKSYQRLEEETFTHKANIYTIDGREWFRMCEEDGNILELYRLDGHSLGPAGHTNAFYEIVGYFTDANILSNTYTSARGLTTAVDGGSASSEIGKFETVNKDPKGNDGQGRFVDGGMLGNLNLGLNLGIHTLRLSPHANADYVLTYAIELIAHDKFNDATCDYNNDPTITMDSTARIVAGMSVTGTGIPAGAKVSSVTNATTFELSAATTGGAVTNGTLTFGTNSINIPPQNVVSYGKKFAVSKSAHHYDPFNGMAAGSNAAALATFIDTATSLGMDKWKAGTANYYRPFQGGRVVKWIANDGTIKTSVTMMPPNAQNLTAAASNAISNTEVQNGTNGETINFDNTAIEYSLTEVAKTFLWREFGNGSANGGTGASHVADATMMNNSTADDLSYTMDDGLTTWTALACRASTDHLKLQPNADAAAYYYTFIGSGITFHNSTSNIGGRTAALNLPYGTHIIKVSRDADSTPDIDIDGVSFADLAADNMTTGFYAYGIIEEVSFHQPKMPPIPEDACIIADYMLMADYVPQAAAGATSTDVPKGTRKIIGSRDFHLTNSTSSAAGNFAFQPTYWRDNYCYTGNVSSGTGAQELPYFGTSFTQQQFTIATYSPTQATVTVNGSNLSSYTLSRAGSGYPSVSSAGVITKAATAAINNYLNAVGGTLGTNVWKHVEPMGPSKYLYTPTLFVDSPIHTSSHYQPFESPYQKELVGGDRNMEQTNLVVTADGKSWDEVTRDTSYIGSLCVRASHNSHYTSGSSVHINDEWRGWSDSTYALMNKDFAIAYNSVICLVDGEYQIYSHNVANNGTRMSVIRVNNTTALLEGHVGATGLGNTTSTTTVTLLLKRGDWVQIAGSSGDYNEWTSLEIRRV